MDVKQRTKEIKKYVQRFFSKVTPTMKKCIDIVGKNVHAIPTDQEFARLAFEHHIFDSFKAFTEYLVERSSAHRVVDLSQPIRRSSGIDPEVLVNEVKQCIKDEITSSHLNIQQLHEARSTLRALTNRVQHELQNIEHRESTSSYRLESMLKKLE